MTQITGDKTKWRFPIFVFWGGGGRWDTHIKSRMCYYSYKQTFEMGVIIQQFFFIFRATPKRRTGAFCSTLPFLFPFGLCDISGWNLWRSLRQRKKNRFAWLPFAFLLGARPVFIESHIWLRYQQLRLSRVMPLGVGGWGWNWIRYWWALFHQ